MCIYSTITVTFTAILFIILLLVSIKSVYRRGYAIGQDVTSSNSDISTLAGTKVSSVKLDRCSGEGLLTFEVSAL